MTTAAIPATEAPKKQPLRIARILVYVGLIALALFYLIPIYVLVSTSLKSYADVSLDRMWQFPQNLTLAGFAAAWSGDPLKGQQGLGGNFFNSVKLVIPALFISVMLGSLNGYALSHFKFRGADILFFLMLFGMFIPYQSVMIPLVRVEQFLGLYGSIPGLVLAHVVYGLPITTLIFRNYYAGIPHDLIEAARIDGAGLLGIYRRIIVPISAPGMVVAIIWQFTQIWNDFLFGVIITNKPSVQPITVALNNLAGSFIVQWNVQMAGALLTALPTVIVYILMGRYFVQGLMAGSVKG